MDTIKRTIFMISALFLILNVPLRAQDEDTFPEGYKRNLIKWNVTPFFLWSKKNINISYERILSPYRSFSINAGYFEMPSTGLFDSLNIKSANKKGGFSISGDYRFYFKNRNKRFAPDGLFWGVYGSYHYYTFNNDIEVIEDEYIQGHLILDGRLSIFSVGAELGYQFALGKRWTVDMVFMGPALALYKTKLTLTGDLSGSDEEYLKAIRDILIGRFPFLDDLIDKGEFDDNGVSASFGYGFRYIIQVSYRF